jgi:hypothetical protein
MENFREDSVVLKRRAETAELAKRENEEVIEQQDELLTKMKVCPESERAREERRRVR